MRNSYYQPTYNVGKSTLTQLPSCKRPASLSCNNFDRYGPTLRTRLCMWIKHTHAPSVKGYTHSIYTNARTNIHTNGGRAPLKNF